MKDMYDKITSEHENAIKLAERQLDRVLDTTKLGKRILSGAKVLGGAEYRAFANKVEKYRDVYDEYASVMNGIAEQKVDLSKTKYGNIDLNNRRAITWDDTQIDKWRDALTSLGWNADDMKDSVSTVMGAFEKFGEKGEIPIAYTPMLQTEHGVEILDQNTLDLYFSSLLRELDGQAKGKNIGDKILNLDATGFIIDGRRVKNIIAAVGDEAERVSEIMHYGGTDGAYSLALRKIASAAAEAKVSINDLLSYFSGYSDSKVTETIKSSIDGDAIESYMNSIINRYREAQKNLHTEAQYYRGMGYSDLSDEVADLSDQWWEYEDAVKDVKQKVIDYLSDIVDAASDSVDTIQDVLDTFKKAAEEYSTNGGFISVDTFQEISKLGVEYMGYLKDENGLLTINEEMINRVIKAKTEQMALESASAYVERLRLALQDNDVVSLNNLLNATADLTECQWSSVYAQLQMLDLTTEGYAQAVNNVNAYRDVFANVKMGIGVDVDDMKDGVDEIFDYVKEMIKDNIDRQVDALEELKDKYGEIIDKKKESLQLTKDEADYQDEVADKVKEMAKLQEKINALSLDDSRESIAKRKDLEEQLADLQKELASDQADHAYDQQTDSLDKMQEAYEKEKDAEIKKLQESIQSAERLDAAARKYIKENWDNLYTTLETWNEAYGSHLTRELQSSWSKALDAAKQYGDYLTALDAIGSSGSNATSSGSSNVIGKTQELSDSEKQDISNIVQRMKARSNAWSPSMTKAEKDALNKANDNDAQTINNKYGLGFHYNGHTGVWYDKNGNNIYDKWLNVYHTGGVVGDASTLRQDEMVAILQKGEIVLDKPKQQSLDTILKVMSAITSGLTTSTLPDLSKAAPMPVSGVNREVVTIPRENVTNVTFGDTIIKGANGDTVKQHEAVSRRMVNDIIEVLKIKK